MGVEDIIKNEPRYAGAYERAREEQRITEQRNQRPAHAATDGGTTQTSDTEGSRRLDVSVAGRSVVSVEGVGVDQFLAGMVVANFAVSTLVLILLVVG